MRERQHYIIVKGQLIAYHTIGVNDLCKQKFRKQFRKRKKDTGLFEAEITQAPSYLDKTCI